MRKKTNKPKKICHQLKLFKRWNISNFAQVAISLAIGFFTTLTVFDSLTSTDFLIFSTVQITIFLFVNFSSLEYEQIIRTKVPSLGNSVYKLTKFNENLFLFYKLLGILYIVFSELFNFYNEFGQKRFYFYIFVILCSIPQLFFNFITAHISASYRFKELEAGYIKYIHPVRILALLVFYFYFPNLLFILCSNFLIRILYLALSINLIGKEFLRKKINTEKQNTYKFSFLYNLKFSLNNFIYQNYPLLFFSVAPIIINRYFNPNDAAVFALSLSIFNAIKPLLNGLATLVNPMIIEITNKRNEDKLFGITQFFIKVISVFSISGLSLFWILFNFLKFTDLVFVKFSYLLFLDYLISVVFISIFYTLTMFQRSYFLANGQQLKFFKKSIYSLILSSFSILLYIQFDLGVNLVFVGMIFFICLIIFFCCLEVVTNYFLIYTFLYLFLFPQSF